MATKSYVSAIKAVLMDDKYEWKDGEILLGSLVHGCKLMNDTIQPSIFMYF